MKPKMKCAIAGGEDTVSLAKEIEKYLNEGYQPIGGIVYVPHQQWGDGHQGGFIATHFYQSMVLIEDPDEQV
jgi:hypothetical protein